MIGYAQLYFKIVGEKEVYYACFDGDFGKPLTRFRLWTLKRSMKRLYERMLRTVEKRGDILNDTKFGAYALEDAA